MTGIWVLIIIYTGNYSATSMQVDFRSGEQACEAARVAITRDDRFFGTAVCVQR